MPRLSDSMEHGLILQWLVEEGQPVAAGDELLEIETDKATMTWQAESDGVLTIIVQAGETVAVGAVIARLGDPGAAATRSAGEPTLQTEPERTPEPVTNAVAQNGEPSVRRPATPVARRLAERYGVALGEVRGTGPRGRITKGDVLAAAGEEPPGPVRLSPTVPVEGNGVFKLSRTQALIARRMSEAKATVPHFQVQTEVVMDRALALREEIKQIVAEGSPAPSVNDLIVRASALALRDHPRANGSYRRDLFELHARVNIGIAVAAEDALVVPTLFDADTKALTEIAADTRRLAARVRSGEITPPELSGATFTVSNLGMYGVTAITPVINPPQAAILGIGAIRPTLARDNGRIVDRSLLALTLSCDHRILYGADAARFLADIKQRLEQPLTLLL
jgi:pyruvate dehydrogenase E2 component (dihydrolipoamide acetyltransferase)